MMKTSGDSVVPPPLALALEDFSDVSQQSTNDAGRAWSGMPSSGKEAACLRQPFVECLEVGLGLTNDTFETFCAVAESFLKRAGFVAAMVASK